MNLKRISLTTGALALSVAAFSANATYFGDENDLSWLPGTQTRYQASDAAVQAGKNDIVRFGDENDQSWLPGAKK